MADRENISRIDATVPQEGTPVHVGAPLRENFENAADEINWLIKGQGPWMFGSGLAVTHFGQTVAQIDPTSINPYRRVLRLQRGTMLGTPTPIGEPLYVRFRILHGNAAGQQRIAQETVISEHNLGTGSGWSIATTNTVGFNWVSDTGGNYFYIDMDARGMDGARTRFQVVETNAGWALENQAARNPDPDYYPILGETVLASLPRRSETWPQHNIQMGGVDGAGIANLAGVPYATVDDVGPPGLTEEQTVNVIARRQIRFEEVPVASAPSWPTTPNAAGAPSLGAGWTLTSGSGATGTYTHATGQTAPLAYPVSFTAGDAYQLVFTQTPSPVWVGNFVLRNGATNTAGQQWLGYGGVSDTILVEPTAAFTHFVVVPSSAWAGTFALSRIVRFPGPVNSQSLSVKDWFVRARGSSLYLGNGGRFATGGDNVTIGTDAGRDLVGASGVVAIGRMAMSRTIESWGSTAVGSYSLMNATTGSNNTAVGADVMTNLRAGWGNTAVGSYAGMGFGANSATNTAIGHYCITSGSSDIRDNVGVGSYAMAGCSHIARNTAIGSGALNWPAGILGAASSDNAAVGYHALRSVEGSWDGVQPRGGNAALGSEAGKFLSNGTTSLTHSVDSIFIGRNSRGSASQGQTNQIVIGRDAAGGGTNTITLGNNQITSLRCNVQTISTLSDPRLKEDIEPADLERCVDAVRTLPVNRWAWAEIAGLHRDKHVTGFLSDDVEKVFPKAVTKADEWFVRYDADGNPVMKRATVEEELLPLRDDHLDPQSRPRFDESGEPRPPHPREARMHTVERDVEDGVMLENAARVELTEIVPTLWGAVQWLLQRVDTLERAGRRRS